MNDVQVLAPMHKGVAGVANLNQQLQNALNPAEAPPAGDSQPRSPATFPPKSRAVLRTVGGEFRPGDKLIQLRNNYDKGLFNGDIGSVVSVAPEAGTLVVSRCRPLSGRLPPVRMQPVGLEKHIVVKV